MPYLLLDDAADEATRRLHQFGQDQLSSLQSAPAQLVQGAQSATASAQDITQRLMQFGQDQLGSLQQQAQPIASNVDDITGRLHAFGQDQLSNLTQAPQAAQSLLTPMAQQAQAAGAQALQPLKPLVDVAQAGNVNLDQGQDQAQPPQGAGAIDSSSVENFAKTMSPYARYAAQALGIDPSWVVAMAGSESNYGKAGGNELFGVKALPGQKGTTMMTHEGEYGGTAQNATFAAYDTPMDAVQAWVDLIRNHYPGAVGAKDLGSFVHGLKQGGYFTAAEDEYRNILSSIQGRVAPFVQGTSDALSAGQQAVQQKAQELTTTASNALPALSQFGDKQLTAAEAYAACGPAAAVRFAQMFGRQPTLREAVDLAKNVGWSAANGMAGLASESKLFDAMGIAHRTVGADWQALAREAQSGNPVAISTPGHYFTADGYDPNTGAFHVGSSGTDLRRGSEWMTPAQMESVMGPLQGGLAADHPLVPGSSPLSAGTATGATGAANRLIDVAGQAKDRAMQMLDQGLPLAGDLATGGLTRRFNENLQDLTQKVLGAGQIDPSQGITPLTGALASGLERTADTADQLGGAGLVPPDLMRAGAGLLRQPGVLDSMQTLEQLATKYGTHDTTQYTPDDQKLAGQAMLTAGGVLAGTDASRMYHGTGAEFPKVDPSRLNPEGLYGPGYYLTSDPRVAGGVVQGETQPMTAVQQSLSDRGLLSPENARSQAGSVLQPGYAQAVQNDPTAALQATLNSYLRRKDAGGMSERMAFMVDQEIDRLRTELANAPIPSSGPNVRAVDVPQDLNLLDVTAPADQQLLQRLDEWLDPRDARTLQERLRPIRNPTNEDVYRALSDIEGPIYANKDLAEAGFDGISHEGGARMPMPDETGQDIRHTVNVIFPESLHKVTNAISGTQGGQADARFALGLGGAAGVGALAANKDRINDTLQGWQSPVTLEDVGKTAADLATGGITRRFNENLRSLGQDVLAPALNSAADALNPMKTPDTTPLGSLAGAISDADVPGLSGAAALARPALESPGVLDSLMLPDALAEKYGTTDSSQYSEVDQQRLEQAQANARIAVGGISSPIIDQSALSRIRTGGLNTTTPAPRGPRGPIARGVDVTKQFMLSGIPGLISNTVGNTLELLSSPVALTLGGRPRDAFAGTAAVIRAVPDALATTLDATRGVNRASLAAPASTTHWSDPIFRVLSASDAFTRTLGEYQGMAEHASHLLTDAGISPSSPRAAAFLASRADDIARMGRRRGSETVFMSDRAAGSSRLDQLADQLSTYKEGLLASPDLRQQFVGALLDTQLPFLGVPTRLLQIGARRLPVASQLTTLYRMTNAPTRAEAQRALGEGIMQTAIQIGLASQIAQGNIRGPDDPDHPGEAQILGNWVNLNNISGGYALPAQIMAAFAEGHAKSLDQPAKDITDEEFNRVGNALNASIKPLAQAVPGMQMMHFLASLGSGAGLSAALQQEVQDTLSRIVAPGLLKTVEDITDPAQRDIARTGLTGLYQPAQARIPGLAGQLPEHIDPTTGEPMEKRRSGPGVLLGVESYDESPIREEANRLAKLGYDTKPPTAYPNQVSVSGSLIKLNPDEQRQVAQITGQRLGNFADRLDSPSYQDADDKRKAALMRAYLDAAQKARESAVAEVLGRDELRKRVQAGTRDTGRLADQGPGLGNVIGELGQRALAGVGR
jgi:flagellum-specific peptidoglycan hydrolase FlgJ